MHNHCVNILRLENRNEENIQSTLKEFLKEDLSLDFNKIIEMPKDLRESMRALEVACADPRINTSQIDKLEKKIKKENLEGYGFETPEEWADEHWGSLYNCYDSHIDLDKNSIIFDTPNSPPLPVLQELCRLTNKSFHLCFAEPGESFYGEVSFQPSGDFEFKEYKEEKDIPITFHDEFPTNYPPKNTPQKMDNKTKGKDKLKSKEFDGIGI